MAAEPAPSAWAPLRAVEYRRLLGASFFSVLGLFLHTVAASWVMLRLTDSPFMVALVTASAFIPRLFASIPAGAVADIVSRRTILIWAHVVNAGFALTLAWLQFTGALTPALIVVLSLGLGLGSSLSLPAYQAIVPDLLPRSLVAAAVSLQSGMFNAARAVGPALGGVLVAADLPDLAFALNGVSYLFVAVAAATFGGDFRADDPEPVGRAMTVGLRYVRHSPLFVRIIIVTALFSTMAGSVQPLLPNIANDDLGLGARGYGILFACFGGGAMLGAVLVERVRMRRAGRPMVPFAIAGFGVAGIVFGLSRNPYLSGAVLAVVGMFWVWTLATLNATVQLSAPRWVRGRAMSIYLMAFTGAYPIGSLTAGAVAESIGAGNAVAIFCTGALAVGLWSRRKELPAIADLVEPTLPEEWAARPHEFAAVAGSPVVVATDWRIHPADAPEFFAVMRELRRHRIRTGAQRWVLFRNAAEPEMMTEVFEVEDWQEHLRQHGRMDAEAVAVIEKARSFDRDGGPHSRHLVGIALRAPEGPPDWDELLAVHAVLHAKDGSIPLSSDTDSHGRQRSRRASSAPQDREGAGT
ncbi:MAG: MFS transporter [Nitriliruptorales bacterium]